MTRRTVAGTPASVLSLWAGMLVTVTVASACARGDTGPEPTPAASPPEATEPAGPQLRWQPVLEGLTVPNDLADLGDGRMLVSDQVGLIHLVQEDGSLADQPVLDLTGAVLPPSTAGLELGLSGFAPHQDFAANGRLFVYYTSPAPEDAGRGVRRVDVLAEFTVPDGQQAAPDSQRVLLRVPQQSEQHVGGHLAFGEDGLLYLGVGDGGGRAHGQDPTTLPGSILRLDVDSGDPYGIPEGNPFADGDGGAPEVFAYGFRNPFRVNWLDGVGLLIAEPMWTAKNQEVHVAAAGGNYGWPDLPSAVPDRSCYESPQSTDPLPECLQRADGSPLVPPVVEYGREVGQIVSGVAPYGGVAIPELAGRIVVSDWHGATLSAPVGDTGRQWPAELLEVDFAAGASFPGFLWALDTDAAGEVYALTATRSFAEGRGVVYRLSPAD